MKRWLVCIYFFTLHLTSLNAQELSVFNNLRSKSLSIDSSYTAVDTLFILPATVQVYDINDKSPIASSWYIVEDYGLRWQKNIADLPDSILINYRCLLFNPTERYSHIDETKFSLTEEDALIGFNYNPYQQEEGILSFGGLDYSGSFARGISFGNNQDLVLNSSFNLQIAGNLGDDVELLAAITDENIPIQPEGNTQQLREFDRIFIQLTRKNNQLIAGDYELRRPNSYFLNYFKKLQGATYSNTSKLSDKFQLNTQASVAIARGKFSRNILTALEGNQGPYKLRGAEGERFIIVLAGTEKVWIDGVLLTRGLEEDYVIDYNRGEITFTPRRLITKDSRIIVEFEYSDQNYLRSIYAVNTELSGEKFRFNVNLYNEQDSKNSSTDQNLTDQNKRVLQAAGDNLVSAIASSIDTLEEFSSFRAMYVLTDTIICGRLDTILTYSTDPETAIYIARFTFVGAGNGNYVIDPEQQFVNERVYKWVPPMDCQPQGNYAPIIQLVPPKQQRMITFGGAYEFSQDFTISSELAFSTFDFNRFSTLNSDDDNGMAAFVNLQKAFQLGKDSSSWRLTTNWSYEYVQEHFQTLNPYRNAEFSRDWNIDNQPDTIDVAENILKGGFRLSKNNWAALQYTFSGFWRDSLYRGNKHEARLQFNRGGWAIDGIGNWLFSNDQTDESIFSRPRLRITKTFKQLDNWQLGFYGESEQNAQSLVGQDTLSPLSFYYNLFRVFAESPQKDGFRFSTFYSQRYDYAPVATEFVNNTIADEFNVAGQWNWRKNTALAINMGGNFTYRQLHILQESLSNQDPAETSLGQFDLGLVLFKGTIRTSSTYIIGSGQEPKLEFNYLPVEPGRGTYIWLDSLFNNDGVIQDNEMAIAPFQDIADFVRVTTFTDEFIRTNNVTFNQNLQIDPRALWYNSKGLKKLLSRFSSTTALKIDRKTQDVPGVSPWNPFQLEIADTALVSVSSSIRSILFFDRFNPKYTFQIGMTDNRNKFVQTSGFESRQLSEQFVEARWNILSALSFKWTHTVGMRKSDSEFFNTKDYEIPFVESEPELTYLPSKNFRTIFRYRYRFDKNRLLEAGESSRQHELRAELTYNRSANTSIRSEFSLVNITFEGVANSPVGFVLLNGLQPGRNYLWQLSFEKRLGKNFQLNLSYEGRKTGAARVVHVGRAQVAAIF